jgi:hypothetical protein
MKRQISWLSLNSGLLLTSKYRTRDRPLYYMRQSLTLASNRDFANSMENLQSLDANFSNSFWMNLDASFSHIPLVSESFQPELDFLGGLPGSYT